METLEEISPQLKLKVSKRARRLALRLDTSKGVIHLVVPKRASMKKAYQFAELNREWIIERLEELPTPVPFENGAVIPLCGDKVTIRIFYDLTLKSTSISLTHKELIVVTNKEDPTGRILRFLKEYARTALADLAQDKAESIGKKIKDIRVRDTRTRWGSCGSDKKICFSWRLIFAPWAALDYVVAHEVAHLSYMDHSPRFWRVCEELSYDYEKGKEWMRTNGHTLMRYGLGNDNEPL